MCNGVKGRLHITISSKSHTYSAPTMSQLPQVTAASGPYSGLPILLM